jgi:hypothetical protein
MLSWKKIPKYLLNFDDGCRLIYAGSLSVHLMPPISRRLREELHGMDEVK